jgi:hypothetical protein
MRRVLQTGTGSLLLPFGPALAARPAAELRRVSSAFAGFVVRVLFGGVGATCPKQPPAEGYSEQITGHPETKASHSRSACVVTSRLWEETERGYGAGVLFFWLAD